MNFCTHGLVGGYGYCMGRGTDWTSGTWGITHADPYFWLLSHQWILGTSLGFLITYVVLVIFFLRTHVKHNDRVEPSMCRILSSH